MAEKLSWQEIAKLTKRRLSRQCSQRWRKVLDPSIKRFVKWTSEEDAKLIELHKTFPTMSNKEMSTYLPGRTSTQCHNRWVEVLNPDLRRGAFSKEEDDCILRLRKNGLGWSAMAKDAILNGRANVALKTRWRTLQRRKSKVGQSGASGARHNRKVASNKGKVANDCSRRSKQHPLVSAKELAQKTKHPVAGPLNFGTKSL